MMISRTLSTLVALAARVRRARRRPPTNPAGTCSTCARASPHISREIYSLHMLIFWVCVVIAVVVFGVMIWSLVKFRKSQGRRGGHHPGPQHQGRDRLDDRARWSSSWPWPCRPRARWSRSRTRATPASPSRSRATSGAGSTTTWTTAWTSILAPRARQRRRAPPALGRGSDHGPALPAERRQAAGRARRREGAPAGHGGRRHPRLVGAGFRHEEGRDPGLRQRNVVQGGSGQDRPLSRPVRRAVRPRPWLHADRGGRADTPRTSRPGSRAPQPHRSRPKRRQPAATAQAPQPAATPAG